jgi:hypothetical protein
MQPGRSGLRLVHDGDREPAKTRGRLPSDPKLREAILMSRGLREMTRIMVQRARAIRSEVHDSLAQAEEARIG